VTLTSPDVAPMGTVARIREAARPVLHRADCFSASVNVFARGLMPYKLLTRYRVLPIGQTLEVLLPHFPGKTPFLCQLVAAITAAEIAQSGTVLVFVFNPPEGGTTLFRVGSG
jgi:hypothetical protein